MAFCEVFLQEEKWKIKNILGRRMASSKGTEKNMAEMYTWTRLAGVGTRLKQ